MPEAIQTGGGKRVLVVDDEDLTRQTITRMLEAGGFTVVTATNGAEALEYLSKRSADVDIVLSDVTMPEMNGIDLSYHIRDRYPRMPVAIVSGDVSDLEKSIIGRARRAIHQEAVPRRVAVQRSARGHTAPVGRRQLVKGKRAAPHRGRALGCERGAGYCLMNTIFIDMLCPATLMSSCSRIALPSGIERPPPTLNQRLALHVGVGLDDEHVALPACGGVQLDRHPLCVDGVLRRRPVEVVRQRRRLIAHLRRHRLVDLERLCVLHDRHRGGCWSHGAIDTLRIESPFAGKIRMGCLRRQRRGESGKSNGE